MSIYLTAESDEAFVIETRDDSIKPFVETKQKDSKKIIIIRMSHKQIPY